LVTTRRNTHSGLSELNSSGFKQVNQHALNTASTHANALVW
jgi:hypothetical protein